MIEFSFSYAAVSIDGREKKKQIPLKKTLCTQKQMNRGCGNSRKKKATTTTKMNSQTIHKWERQYKHDQCSSNNNKNNEHDQQQRMLIRSKKKLERRQQVASIRYEVSRMA